MAGHRRERRSENGEPLPTMRRGRLQKRREALALRYSTAKTEPARFAAAYDYTRGAAARRQPDQQQADQILAEATEAVIRAGDRLLRLQGQEPLRRGGTA